MSSLGTPIPNGSLKPESLILGDSINNLANSISSLAPKAEKKSDWTGLEIAKLVISALTPILVVILGIYVSKVQHRNEVLATARVKSYDAIKEDLNRIHCFITDRGTWKEETPATVVGYKRVADREMYEEQGIWSPATMTAFLAYMDAAFTKERGSGLGAGINTTLDQKRNSPKWDDTWKTEITNQKSADYEKAYEAMYKAFAADITQ